MGKATRGDFELDSGKPLYHYPEQSTWEKEAKEGVEMPLPKPFASEIKVARPGVVLRKRVARKLKYCAACGCLISPGGAYWDRKCSWQRVSRPICGGCG